MPRNKEFDYNSVTKDDKVDKVIVVLKGSKSKKATALAKQFDEVNKKKKEIIGMENKLKEDMKQLASDLFNINDSVYTRVLETASVVITATKMSTRENFDSEKFLEKISKEFPKLVAKFNEIADECKKITNVDSNIKVTMKEGIGDSIKSVYNKLKAQITKIVDSIKSYLDNYDDKLNDWKQELVSNIKVESLNRTIRKSNYLLG